MPKYLNSHGFSAAFRRALWVVAVLGGIGGGAIAFPTAALADTYVHGYHRKDGTYVAPHYRSDPDSSRFNNYSTRGNVNPYTGREGTVDPYRTPSSPPSNYGYGGGPSQYQNPYRAPGNYWNEQ